MASALAVWFFGVQRSDFILIVISRAVHISTSVLFTWGLESYCGDGIVI